MKRKISYWTVPGLFLLMMTGSALGYLIGSQHMIEAFRHLGYAEQFGREWAYAGFGVTMIAAVISHISIGDSAAKATGPIVALALLVAARPLWQKSMGRSVAYEGSASRRTGCIGNNQIASDADG